MKFVLGKEQEKFIPKMVEAMTYEEARRMLSSHQAWARSESPRYAAAVEVAIKSLEAWDEVLDKLKNEEEECEYYGDPGGAMGLGMARRIIERKLKEVEE